MKVASSILRRCARGDSLISRESIFLQQLRKSPADCGRYRINSTRDPADVHDIFRPPVFSRRPAPRFHNGNVKRVVDSQRSSLLFAARQAAPVSAGDVNLKRRECETEGREELLKRADDLA